MASTQRPKSVVGVLVVLAQPEIVDDEVQPHRGAEQEHKRRAISIPTALKQVADQGVVGSERGDVEPEDARASRIFAAPRTPMPTGRDRSPLQPIEDGQADSGSHGGSWRPGDSRTRCGWSRSAHVGQRFLATVQIAKGLFQYAGALSEPSFQA